MRKLAQRIAKLFGKPHLVEFDYRDSVGMHHGRCYVRYLFGSPQQVKRLLSSYGYTNIRII